MNKGTRIWSRILGFKEGDRVRIVGTSQYTIREAREYFLGKTGTVIRSLYHGKLLLVALDEPDEYKTAFVGIPDDLEHLEEERDEE